MLINFSLFQRKQAAKPPEESPEDDKEPEDAVNKTIDVSDTRCPLVSR